MLRIIAESSRANREAFRSGMCRFRYTIHHADSEPQAIASKWKDRYESVFVESTLYVDGEKMTLKSEIDNDELVRRLKADAPVLQPINIAQSGRFAIDHDSLTNTAIVHAPDNYTLVIPYHPFNLAFDSSGLDPASLIEEALSVDFNGVSLTIEESERDGRPYVLLKQSRADSSSDWHYYLDPERGYLPFYVEIWRRDPPKLRGRMVLLDVYEQNGAFFPMHAMFILPRTPPDVDPYVEVREMKVSALDLTYVPTDEDLTIYLPKVTQYSNGVDPDTAKTLYRDQDEDYAAVSVDDLEPLYNQLLAGAEEVKAAETLLAQGGNVHRERDVSWVVLSAINVVAFGAIVALWVIRRRRAGVGTK